MQKPKMACHFGTFGNSQIMRCRNGASQIDWIMSLGIFMTYLAWFFIFVRPFTSEPITSSPLVEVIEENLLRNATWTMESVPLVILSNITSDDEPVIARTPYPWNISSFSFADNRTFYLDNDLILMIINLTSGRNLNVVAHSSENYAQPAAQQRDLYAISDSATIGKGMKAEFRDSALQRLSYNGKYRIQNMNISVNSIQLDTANSSFTSLSNLAKYHLQTDLVNHTTYIFADNTRLYNYLRLNKPHEQSQNFSISGGIANSTRYYTDQGSGIINFNSTCSDFTTNYIDLYDDTSGLSFIFSDAANVSLCGANTTIRFGASFILKSQMDYTMILHQGAYNNTIRYKAPYIARFGLVEKKTGISGRALMSVNGTNYNTLKRIWGFPQSRHFSYTIIDSNNSAIYTYQPSIPPESANVFAKEFRTQILDQYGNRQQIIIRMNTW